jgi:hypothetical protein
MQISEEVKQRIEKERDAKVDDFRKWEGVDDVIAPAFSIGYEKGAEAEYLRAREYLADLTTRRREEELKNDLLQEEIAELQKKLKASEESFDLLVGELQYRPQWVKAEARRPAAKSTVVVEFHTGEYDEAFFAGTPQSEEWFLRSVKRWLEETLPPTNPQ